MIKSLQILALMVLLVGGAIVGGRGVYLEEKGRGGFLQMLGGITAMCIGIAVIAVCIL